MSERSDEPHKLDRQRSPEEAARIRSLASQVVGHHGGDLVDMRRALGYSNATWVGGGLAIRISTAPVADDMSNEVALVKALPEAVGHPRILDTGTIEGHDWILTQECRGQNLQEVWPTLESAARVFALRRLWERATVIHDATAQLADLTGDRSWFVPLTLGDALERVQVVSRDGDLNPDQSARATDLVSSFYAEQELAPLVVTHGDLAFVNALWADGDVVALLDLEFSTLAPVEVDLCRLLWEGLVAEAPERDSAVAAAAVEIAGAAINAGAGLALLHGAAVLSELRDLATWLARRTPQDAITEWRPHRLLTGLLNESGGYLAPVMQGFERQGS